MLLTLLSLLGGGLARILPEIFSAWKDYSDNKHELSMLQLQLDASDKLNNLKLQYAESQLDVQAHKALYESTIAPSTGNKFVDLCNSIVRPYTVFVLLTMYVVYKLVAWSVALKLINVDMPWFMIADRLYSEFDEMMLSSIISFYFVGRSFDKYKS